LNDRPLKIGELVTAWRHDLSSFKEFESHSPRRRNPLYEFMT
jgi:hypothetical protein